MFVTGLTAGAARLGRDEMGELTGIQGFPREARADEGALGIRPDRLRLRTRCPTNGCCGSVRVLPEAALQQCPDQDSNLEPTD